MTALAEAPATTIRAAIYCRISLDKGGDAHGVEDQLQHALKVAAARGYTVVATFSDNDISALTGKLRPDYDRLMAAAERGEFDVIIAFQQSRIWRNRAERAAGIDALKRLGLCLVAVKGMDVDFSTSNGRLMSDITGSVETWESEVKGERVAAAQGERVAAGRWIGGQRPFGWQLDPDPALAGTPLSGRKVLPRVDEHEAAEVRRLTDELLAGTSLASLVRDLNERGITTTTGKRWSSISLRRVLTRPRNFGAVSYAGELVRATWPAIVPEAKVQRVMQLLADPERRTSTTNVARYLLSGIATCGRCGAKVKTGQSRSQRGQPRRLYQCSQGDHVWRAVRVADHVVVSTVLIRLQSMSPEKRMALLAPDADPELEAEASRLRARIETYLDLLDSGDITKAQFRDRRSKAMAALKVIERKQAQASSAPVLSEIMSAEDVRASWDATPFDRQRSILDTLVGVAINPGAKIRSNSALNQQTAAVAVTWKLGFPEDDAWTRLIEG